MSAQRPQAFLMLLIIRLVFIAVLLSLNSASYAEEPQQPSLENLLAAEFALQRGQYEQAAHIYLDAAREQPSNSDITERATKLALHTKNFNAFLEMAKLWHNTAANPASRLHLALAYGFNQQAQQALNTMLPLLDQEASSNFTQLAQLLDKQIINKPSYLDQLDQAVSKHPQHLDLILASALSFSLTDDEEKALHYLDQALALNGELDISEYATLAYQRLNRPDLALQYLQEQIQSYPYRPQLQNQLLYIAESQGKESFQEQLTFLVHHAPGNNRYLISLASLYLQHSQNDLAEALFKQALHNQADYSPAHFYLGMMYARAGELEAAASHLSVVSDENNYWNAQEYLAYIYLEQNQHTQAEQIIQQYFKQHKAPDRHVNWLMLKSSSLEKQGKTKQALRFLNKLIRKQSDDIDLRYARAMLAEKHSKLALCESDLRHILSLEPDHAISLNALGYILTDRTERHEEAYQLIAKAYEIAPNDPATIDSMGWVLHHLNRHDEALAYLERAYKLLPDAEVAAHLIEVLWVTGNTAQASILAKQALQNWPDHPKLLKTVKDFDI